MPTNDIFAPLDDIYDRLFAILSDDTYFGYMRTRQRGFFAHTESSIVSNMFPWAFIEFGSISEIAWHQSPNVFTYEVTFPLVVMTWADKGDPTALVFNPNRGNESPVENKNPGIGDIMQDVGRAYWPWHNPLFGVPEVVAWTMSRIGSPDMLSIQGMLGHLYVRGAQINFTFQIKQTTPL